MQPVSLSVTENAHEPVDKQHVSALDSLNLPGDLRQMDAARLKTICQSVRDDMIKAVAKTGGHLGAGLGVVELTVALHATFNTPDDKIIWDVGHQAYPHKILTGRRDRIDTIRQGNGLSGFTKRSESVFDPFGAAHSSTSISAGLGMAVARDMAGHTHKVIAVIGDGAMSAGMAYEAMNNAGFLNANMLIILNDNDMSIAPPTGALSRHLSKLVSSRPYVRARELAKRVVKKLPEPIQKAAAFAEESIRTGTGGSLFEALGLYYIGPVDGHDLDTLLPILKNWRDGAWDGPVLLHIRTQKGKGYAPAENAADKMHGVTKFCVVTGTQDKGKPANAPSYTNVFAKTLIHCADSDPKIIGVTAAMPSGTGLDLFGKAHPSRCFDVGIAEQHAVTFAAGLSTEGFKPFCAIYSTFLQRAYDQVVHDVCIQNLPVRFAIDRAGLVGADGATHAGSFDVAYLACLPNMVVMAASDEAELARMVVTAANHNTSPIAFRYPRGNGTGVDIPANPAPLDIGKGRVLRQGNDVALLSFGTRLTSALEAAEHLHTQGISVTVADARFAKPLDTALVEELVQNHKALITLEEGSAQGFGAIVLQHLAQTGLLDSGRCKIRTLHLPDMFQDHDTQDKQYAQAGLDSGSIKAEIIKLLF